MRGGPPPTPYRFRRDRSLFWTVTLIAAVLAFATWLAWHYATVLNRF